MSFSKFNEQTVLTESGMFYLQEGIDHLEALPHDRFIKTLRSLTDFIISEKLDGSNLVFGFDESGKFYTSREAKNKNGKRYHSPDDYTDRAADNGFKSAHAALQKVEATLRSFVKPGEAIETEVLFGRQPNAIVYGSNHIAFLRAIPGDSKLEPNQNVVTELGKALNGIAVSVNVPIISTDDGIEITKKDTDIKYKFASVSYIDSQHFANVDVDKELKAFEDWLKETGSTGIKNGDLLTVNLTSIRKSERPAVKSAREEAIRISNEKFKLPIKEKFLDSVLRKMKPALRDVDVNPHENFGIEGVVLLNPKTLEQLKIVDKDVFTTINQFNHAVRNQIKFAVGKRPDFASAKLPTETDVFGDMLHKIEQATGIAGVGRYSNIKRVLRKLSDGNAEQTTENIARSINSNTNKLKKDVEVAVQAGLTDLSKSLEHYQSSWRKISAKLQTGADIRYTDSIHSRTLMVFAEVRNEMEQMLRKIQSATTTGDVVLALFGRQIKEISS